MNHKQPCIIACILLALTAPAFAEVILADSLELSDVQAAVDAAQDGDTVLVPPGSATWSSSLTIVDKGIVLLGAGIVGPPKDSDTTEILNTGSGYAIEMTTQKGVLSRIAGFAIDGNESSGGVFVRGTSLAWRIDHNTFANCKPRAIEIGPYYTYGLIDNNVFTDNQSTDIVIYADDSVAWDRPVTLGTDQAVYVEANLFTHAVPNAHSISSNHGARYVFRYNVIQDTYTEGSGTEAPIDAHGNCYYGRGTVSYEIYGNTISSDRSYRGMYIRGGTGVIFDNNLSGTIQVPIHLTNYQSFSTSCGPCTLYPCPDQITQLYIWGNTFNDAPVAATVMTNGLVLDHIQVDRDFFESELDGYTPLGFPHPLSVEEGDIAPPSRLRISD